MNAQLPPEQQTSQLAQLCKAAGDPLRLEVLRALAANSYGVLELSEAFDVGQSGMSHHLKVLTRVGLVTFRKEGNSIFYRRSHLLPADPLGDIKCSLLDSLDRNPLRNSLKDKLDHIHQGRSAASQRFFVENAQKFREQQDLIASYSVYAQPIKELLGHTRTPQNARALEVGPGEGEFLPVLAQRFDSVEGIDNSQSMLNKANALIRAIDLDNVQLTLADTGHLQGKAAHYDCAVLNMVLHHTPSPRQVFFDLSAAIKRGGALLLTELCLHNQAWTQQACGDIWLGFDPADLTSWASEAGFAEGQSVFFALRNGFQIQVRQFFKH